MATQVYGARITIRDFYDPATESATLGLYNRVFDLTADATGTYVTVSTANAALVSVGDVGLLVDDLVGPEVVTITSVDTATGRLYCTVTGTAYEVAQNAKITFGSQFRWIKNDIDSVTGWASGMLLARDGIGTIRRNADIIEGGNVADPMGARVAVKNTSQFWKSLTDLGASLVGARAEIVLFEADEYTVLFDGTVARVSWDVATYSIDMTQYAQETNANISSIVSNTNFDVESESPTIGKSVPVTFGEWRDRYAKMIATDFKSAIAYRVDATGKSTEFVSDGDTYYMQWDIAANADIEAFPCVFADDEVISRNEIIMAISGATFGNNWYKNGASILPGAADIAEFFTGKYVVFVSGSGSSQSARRIINAEVASASRIVFDLDDYTHQPIGGSYAIGPDTYISIYDFAKAYNADTWPCVGFIGESTGDVVDDGIEVYTGDAKSTGTARNISTSSSTAIVDIITDANPGYQRIPEYAIDTDATAIPDRNKATVDRGAFSEARLENISEFVKVYPVAESINERTTSVPITLGSITTTWTPSSTVPGVLLRSFYGIFPQVTEKTGNFSDFVDNDEDTGVSVDFLYPSDLSGIGAAYGVFFSVPEILDEVEISEAYLMVSIKYSELDPIGAASLFRRFVYCWTEDIFFGTKETITLSELLVEGGGLSFSVSDFIDNGVIGGGKKFFLEQDGVAEAGNVAYTGRAIFKLPNVSSLLDLKKITTINVVAGTYWAGSTIPTAISISLNEIAVVYKTKSRTPANIYGPFYGRKINDTWAARKTATNPVTYAPDILEHACRLQRTAKFGSSEPVAGWGKAYSPGARIDTTAFDSAELNPVRIPYAGQFEGNDARTDEIKRKICRNAMMLSFAKIDGSESVVYLSKTATTPTDTITLSGIVAGSNVSIQEPDPTRIYCQPVIRYDKDAASGEYKGIISASRTDDMDPAITDATKQGRVVGLTGTDAVQFWDRCHELFLKAGAVYDAPAYLTDLEFASGTSGNAWAAARRYALDWSSWMGARTIRFVVPPTLDAGSGDLVRDWNLGRRIYVQFPHETDDALIECIVYSMEIPCEAPFDAVVQAVMLDEYQTAYEAQEVLYTVSGGADRDIQETLDIADPNIQEVL